MLYDRVKIEKSLYSVCRNKFVWKKIDFNDLYN